MQIKNDHILMFLGAFAFIAVFSVMPMKNQQQLNPMAGVAQVGSLLPNFFPTTTSTQQIIESTNGIIQTTAEVKNPIQTNTNNTQGSSTTSSSPAENKADMPVGEGSYYASPASAGCPVTNYSLDQNPNTAGYRNVEAKTQVYLNGRGECVFDASLYIPPSMLQFVNNVVWTIDDVPLQAFTSSLAGSIKNGLTSVEVKSDYTLLCVDFDLTFNQSNSQHGRECRSFTNAPRS